MATVARLADGRVDPDCPVVDVCLDAFHDVASRSGQALEDGIVELLPVLLEARWPELFVPLAWGEDVPLAPFAPFHVEAWAWWARIGDVSPPALVACWPRGAGKSTTISYMLALTCLAGLRDYCLWVGAREKAITDKVAGVGALLAAPRVRRAFPEQTALYHDPMTGAKQDWRQGRVATGSGFAVDAVGMDQALRGALRLSSRPGFVILDDIETGQQTAYMRAKVGEQVTRAIIPTQSDDAALAWVQNRLHDDSLMAGMLEGRLDWFRRRTVSGPWPQIRDLEVELEDTPDGPQYSIVGGEATWAGADLEVSEKQINDEGLLAFLAEKQHQSGAVEGSLFPREFWGHADAAPPPGLRVCRAWDLAGTAGRGDFTAGVLLGVDPQGAWWVLDVARGQWDTDRVEDMVLALADQDRAEFGRCPVIIEDQPGAAGKAWGRRWVRHILVGHVVELVAPQGSKVWRADALSSSQRKGLVSLVGGAWVDAFVGECALFGTDFARHDDQVDAVALAFNHLAGRGRRVVGRVASAAGRQIA